MATRTFRSHPRVREVGNLNLLKKSYSVQEVGSTGVTSRTEREFPRLFPTSRTRGWRLMSP